MPSQQAIRSWFNRTYAEKGLTYLRPSEFYSIFLEYLDVGEGHRLLDLGCGPGLLLGQARARGAFAAGIDLSERGVAMVSTQAPGAYGILCNAESLCFPDSTFDYLTCIGVFEHILDSTRALSEMRRVIRPAGRICIMVPNSFTLKWQIESKVLRIHDDDSNERAATFEFWRDLFLSNGFTIDQVFPDEWPAFKRRRRIFGFRCGEFSAVARRKPRARSLRFANQFVFILRS
jgi:SAM-dependent methyltransferase